MSKSKRSGMLEGGLLGPWFAVLAIVFWVLTWALAAAAVCAAGWLALKVAGRTDLMRFQLGFMVKAVALFASVGVLWLSRDRTWSDSSVGLRVATVLAAVTIFGLLFTGCGGASAERDALRAQLSAQAVPVCEETRARERVKVDGCECRYSDDAGYQWVRMPGELHGAPDWCPAPLVR